jgi:steroid Delta-isomerase
MPDGEAVLHRHVQLFNEGIRSGDFGPMLEQFAGDAQLLFEGVPVGPFLGKEAIAEAYRLQPPDDEIDVLDVREDDGVLAAGYAWRREPGRRAGDVKLGIDAGRIRSLTVTFA